MLIAKLQAKLARGKQAYRERYAAGTYGQITVYKVSKTTVKRHRRSGFTAVRVTR